MKVRIIAGMAVLSAAAALIAVSRKSAPSYPADFRDAVSGIKSGACYMKEEGCKTVNNLYLVRKWAFKNDSPDSISQWTNNPVNVPVPGLPGVSVPVTIPKPTDTCDVAHLRDLLRARYWRKPLGRAEFEKLCNSAQHTTGCERDTCRKLFDEILVLDVEQTGNALNIPPEGVRVNAELRSGSSYRQYTDDVANEYNARVEVNCKQVANRLTGGQKVWMAYMIRLRVDKPWGDQVSKGWSVAGGASLFGLGVDAGYSESSSISNSHPYGQTYYEVNMGENVYCGSDDEQEYSR